jgi:hypothetical protein
VCYIIIYIKIIIIILRHPYFKKIENFFFFFKVAIYNIEIYIY